MISGYWRFSLWFMDGGHCDFPNSANMLKYLKCLNPFQSHVKVQWGRGGERAKVLHHRADVFGLCVHVCPCFSLPCFNLACLLEVDTIKVLITSKKRPFTVISCCHWKAAGIKSWSVRNEKMWRKADTRARKMSWLNS